MKRQDLPHFLEGREPRTLPGIYIHIPFCRQACRYCDFFFSVSLKYAGAFTDSLLAELEQRAESCSDAVAPSLYLGGGTPSALPGPLVERIVHGVRALYTLDEDAECTLECNPDDVNQENLELWKELGFNRLSIGIQSFREEDLELMRRSHTARQAEQAMVAALEAGFENITVDLIYGIPGQGPEHWRENLRHCFALPPVHLSAYHLSFESGTVFDHWRKKGRIIPVEQEESEELYRILCEEAAAKGFEHYEISNFAKEGWRSRHNQLYWSGLPYLGFGPSAHSFDGKSRSWNPSDLKAYMEKALRGEDMAHGEVLSREESYHDYLITSLRTSTGADPEYILAQFGRELCEHFRRGCDRLLDQGKMREEGGRIRIEAASWLLTDAILRDLFTDR